MKTQNSSDLRDCAYKGSVLGPGAAVANGVGKPRKEPAGREPGGGETDEMGTETKTLHGGKTPIYGYLPKPSMVDFPGKLSTVLFTSGCNFRCGFCHNCQLMGVPRRGLTWEELDQVIERGRQDWVEGLVITGGEPTCHPDLPGILRFLGGRGLALKLDTNGSRPEVLERVLPLVQFVAMDFKCSLPRYPELTTWSDLEAVVRSLQLIHDSDLPYELRTTVVPGFHDEEEMRAMGETVKGCRRWVLQAFLPQDNLPDPAFRRLHRTDHATLAHYQELLADCADEVVVRG